MNSDELRERARSVVTDPTLTFPQRRHHLAALAEESLAYPALSDAAADALNKRIVCDLYEGHAPYRARYILPDYARFVAQGSAFLELDPPRDLDEALYFLLILYGQVPSITGYPVYLGDLDKVLAPFAEDFSEDELFRKLRPFWIALDRMLPDAFTHTDIGPDDTRLGRTILRLERELRQVVPNVTLKVDPERTPDDMIRDAVETVIAVAKPHFVNHPLMVRDLGEDYAAVSCYNSLKIGGGAHTLVRLNLKEAALRHRGGTASFITDTMAHYAELTAEVMEARIRFLVEEARFFDHDFLAREGLISLDRFSAMFGVVGLAEAVDLLQEQDGRPGHYGHDEDANALSYRITQALADFVAARAMPYCDGGGGRSLFHSQAGLDSDVELTAGTRIPVGTEPGLYEHISAVAPHHDLFPSGVSDVFHVDETVERNPEAMVDVIRGSFAVGMRDFTFNVASNEFIRITGYLVRKSDVAAFADEGARHGSTAFAAGSVEHSHVTERSVKRVVSHERGARPTQ